jgi:hypothetical protein
VCGREGPIIVKVVACYKMLLRAFDLNRFFGIHVAEQKGIS